MVIYVGGRGEGMLVVGERTPCASTVASTRESGSKYVDCQASLLSRGHDCQWSQMPVSYTHLTLPTRRTV